MLLTVLLLVVQDRAAAPELDGGKAWLNVKEPFTLKAARGKVVLLHFWTFG